MGKINSDDNNSDSRRRRGGSSGSSAATTTTTKSKRKICRHWVRTNGQCLYGSNCKFLHPPLLVLAEEGGEMTAKTEAEAEASASSSPHHQQYNKHRSRTRPNRTNTNRTATFRRFLLDTFGTDIENTVSRFNQGSGVVEIAAGLSGGVSFELLNLNSVQCTAIEPLGPLNLRKRMKKLQKGVYHRNRVFQKYNTVDATDVKYQIPRHWRLFFDVWMGSNDDDIADDNSFRHSLKKSIQRVQELEERNCGSLAHRRFSSCCGHNEAEYCDDDESYYCCCFGGRNCREKNTVDDASSREVSTDKEDGDNTNNDNGDDTTREEATNDRKEESEENVKRNKSNKQAKYEEVQQQPIPTTQEINNTIQNASILIGMHPDQPTEAIVDLALQLNKPFAVVPCCVFPNLFPHRALYDSNGNGFPVRSYEHFITYLCEKDNGIRTADFGFGGRSVVLYFDPLL